MLTEHGAKIAPSTYYETRNRAPSKRALRDAEITGLIQAAREHRFRARFGARKMWLHLRAQGHDVARCTVERLMAGQGWTGALRGKPIRTTIADPRDVRPGDLVDRDFTAPAPNRLWVADFTYVATWSGTVYVAFVFDVYSRRIVGWRAATRMTTELVLDCLEHAIWTRQRDGVSDLTGLVHHTDAGSQYTSFAFTSRLIDTGVDPSVGSVGDAYDNALAETTIGLYKTECTRPGSPFNPTGFAALSELESATADWVDWYNTGRLMHRLGLRPPLEAETNYYADHVTDRQVDVTPDRG